MLDLLKRCFPEQINKPEWQKRLSKMIPSYGKPLDRDAELCEEVRDYTSKVLGLKVPEVV